MTYLRHRLKDDYVLMNKAAVNSTYMRRTALTLDMFCTNMVKTASGAGTVIAGERISV
ncbi:MAG: hypothetical protein ACLS9K_05655 [Lachnospira eligens]